MLPNVILVEIVGLLPVLDIIRMRLVSRQILKITKERSVWLSAYRHIDSPLPPTFDLEMTPTAEIERLLVSGAVMERIWGRRPTRQPQQYVGYDYKDIHNELVVDSLGPYVLVRLDKDHERGLRYEWYLGKAAKPAFIYQFPEHVEAFSEVVECFGTKTTQFHLAFVVTEKVNGREMLHLKILLLTLAKKNQLAPKVLHQTPLEHVSKGEMTIKIECGYVLVSQKNKMAAEVVQIKTGKKVVLLPTTGAGPSALYIEHKLTPRHLIVVKEFTGSITDPKTLEFYDLERALQFTPTSEVCISRPTHVHSLPFAQPIIAWFPRSPLSYVTLGYHPEQEDFILMTVDLDPNSTSVQIQTSSRIIWKSRKSYDWTLGHLQIPEYSPTSKSILGAALMYVDYEHIHENSVVALKVNVSGEGSDGKIGEPELEFLELMLPPTTTMLKSRDLTITSLDVFNDGHMVIQGKWYPQDQYVPCYLKYLNQNRTNKARKKLY